MMVQKIIHIIDISVNYNYDNLNEDSVTTFPNVPGSPTVVTNEEGKIVDFIMDISEDDIITLDKGLDIGVIAFDDKNFEIILKVNLNIEDVTGTNNPIINLRKNIDNSLQGITITTHKSVVSTSLSGEDSTFTALTFGYALYEGESSATSSPYFRKVTVVDSKYYLYTVKNKEILIFKIVKSGNNFSAYILDEYDNIISQPGSNKSIGMVHTFETQLDDCTIEIGSSTGRDGSIKTMKLGILSFEIHKI